MPSSSFIKQEYLDFVDYCKRQVNSGLELDEQELQRLRNITSELPNSFYRDDLLAQNLLKEIPFIRGTDRRIRSSKLYEKIENKYYEIDRRLGDDKSLSPEEREELAAQQRDASDSLQMFDRGFG